MYVNSFYYIASVTKHKENNVCKELCSVSTIFDGFQPTSTLAPQPIYQKAKQNVFKFLNTKNLLLSKQCQKKSFTVLFLSPSFTGCESTRSSFIITYFHRGVNKSTSTVPVIPTTITAVQM